MSQHILVLGAGNVGPVVSLLLIQEGYRVTIVDFEDDGLQRLSRISGDINCRKADVGDERRLAEVISDTDPELVVSCLPHDLTEASARQCLELQRHFVAATEERVASTRIRDLSSQAAKKGLCFSPNHGVAPGIIGMLASHALREIEFDSTTSLVAAVGGLPQEVPDNEFAYHLTWSPKSCAKQCTGESLILKDGQTVTADALSITDHIQFNGVSLEGSNTVGGLAFLPSIYQGQINSAIYLTMRYPGFFEKARSLLREGGLPLLTSSLEGLPQTDNDVVYIFVGVKRADENVEYRMKITPATISGTSFTAMQRITAAGICEAVRQILDAPDCFKGFTGPEQFSFEKLLSGPFGNSFEEAVSTSKTATQEA